MLVENGLQVVGAPKAAEGSENVRHLAKYEVAWLAEAAALQLDAPARHSSRKLWEWEVGTTSPLNP